MFFFFFITISLFRFSIFLLSCSYDEYFPNEKYPNENFILSIQWLSDFSYFKSPWVCEIRDYNLKIQFLCVILQRFWFIKSEERTRNPHL